MENSDIKIVPFKAPDVKEIRSLLSFNQLPFEDIETSPIQFFGIKFNNKIVAAGALEVYNNEAILRSLVVQHEFRNLGFGKKMLRYLENVALKSGISRLFLLTTTAHNYFLKEGYNLFERKDCPAEIYSSSEFKDLCPSTAICMKKDLY